MTKDKALKLALEALEGIYHGETRPVVQYKTLKVIKEALAQPAVPEGHKQELVAYIGMIDEEHFADVCRKANGNSNTPLYTSPPKREWVGLTGQEKYDFRYSHMTTADLIDAIEAKLKEKNT